ncbi:MAG: metal-sensing transcriptional repressor [Granulosicoccus sp.]
MVNESKHSSHPKIINRLKRADGHLRRVISMIEEEQSCKDIAQQLQAVEKAIVQAKRTLIHDHIDHCFGDSGDQHQVVSDLKAIARFL